MTSVVSKQTQQEFTFQGSKDSFKKNNSELSQMQAANVVPNELKMLCRSISHELKATTRVDSKVEEPKASNNHFISSHEIHADAELKGD